MVRSHVGEPPCLISRSSVAERRLDKAEVDGSFPSAGTSFTVSVWRRWQRACFGNTRVIGGRKSR